MGKDCDGYSSSVSTKTTHEEIQELKVQIKELQLAVTDLIKAVASMSDGSEYYTMREHLEDTTLTFEYDKDDNIY